MKYNFYAGPAILPNEVLKEAAQSINSFGKHELSILEISHRSEDFVAVMDEAEALIRSLLGVSDEYAVLFLTGGASSQFFISAMNLLKKDETASYLDTGTWSSKCIKEAKHFGNINVVASSKDSKYNHIPKNYEIASGSRYLHLTSNNTIYGTQLHHYPKTDTPLVVDMSSDIFSKPIDVSGMDLIYAGAQKNLGPAGVTLVIVKKDILGKTGRDIPSMLDYRTHIAKGSMFNTPPVYPIYVCMLTLRWLEKNGGLAAMQSRNEEKGQLIYNTIDDLDLYAGHAVNEDRSLMNVTFNLTEPALEVAFAKACDEAGCVGIEGHRSVGGFRASTYNAMDIEGVRVLTDVMKDFALKHG